MREGGVGNRNSTRKWMDTSREASGQSSQVPWTRIPIWSEKGHFPGCERKMEEERGGRTTRPNRDWGRRRGKEEAKRLQDKSVSQGCAAIGIKHSFT